MQKQIKTYVDDMVMLYENNNGMLKLLEKLLLDQECPQNIKNDVLTPIRSKMGWLKNALESKLKGKISVQNYKSEYNQAIKLNEVTRAYMGLTEPQQDVFRRIIKGLKAGVRFELKVIEPEEEIF